MPLAKKISLAVCRFLSIVGILCFLAPSLTQGILPSSFEWPIGYASNVITTPAGLHIVPHDSSGRIQIYNSDWKFIRGWNVPASGGAFKLISFDPETQQLEVVTARGNHEYIYNMNGELWSEEIYLPDTYDSFPNTGISVWVPTYFWLLPLTHPFLAIATAAIAGLARKKLNKNKSK